MTPALLLFFACTGLFLCAAHPRRASAASTNIVSAKKQSDSSVQEHTKRLLPLQGACNVRDLGGYTTTDNRRVVWGRLFRSDDLAKLTSADLTILAQVPIKTYVDFRAADEVATAPDRKAASVTQTIWLPINPGNVNLLTTIRAGQAEKAMQNLNRALVYEFQETYTEFFQLVLEQSNAPLLFHCSAGKDRTGYAAALFLAALGVERKTIFEDYMLSADLLSTKYADWIAAEPEMKDALTVKPSYLEAAFKAIDSEFGGVNAYMTKKLGVDIEKLKQLYTI